MPGKGQRKNAMGAERNLDGTIGVGQPLQSNVIGRQIALTVVDGTQAGGAYSSATGIPRVGFFRRHFAKPIALAQSGFPFSVGRYSSPIDRFRAFARRTRFARHSRLMRAIAAIVMTLGWPFGAFSAARFAIRNRRQAPNGSLVLLDMYWLALRHNIPPMEYALYCFNESARRKDMHEYVYWNDIIGLAALNARLGADNRDVQDKDRFAEICAARGFPHVRTLAVFKGGRQVYPATRFVPDIPQIWTKALRLLSGAGGARWVRDGTSYRNSAGLRVPAASLGEEFRKQDCLVQPYIDNHPDIARITNQALAALRIVTGLNEHAEAEFVTSVIVLPIGAHEPPVAGVGCSITAVTGRIRYAELPDGMPVRNHPDTGALIIGIDLPFWRESVDLVRRAHAIAFPRFAFLGWDVALTKDGPLLLEANSGWGALLHQKLDGPLGHTIFSRLVSLYV
jgi:Sugar-transfer associated ATP-grasp